jgi:hypothetical protein
LDPIIGSKTARILEDTVEELGGESTKDSDVFVERRGGNRFIERIVPKTMIVRRRNTIERVSI